MGVRDGGCTEEHCDVPPGLCHAHHDIPWSQGGPTSVESGRLLCPHHHRRIHDPRYDVTRLPNGKIRFHRRECEVVGPVLAALAVGDGPRRSSTRSCPRRLWR